MWNFLSLRTSFLFSTVFSRLRPHYPLVTNVQAVAVAAVVCGGGGVADSEVVVVSDDTAFALRLVSSLFLLSLSPSHNTHTHATHSSPACLPQTNPDDTDFGRFEIAALLFSSRIPDAHYAPTLMLTHTHTHAYSHSLLLTLAHSHTYYSYLESHHATGWRS